MNKLKIKDRSFSNTLWEKVSKIRIEIVQKSIMCQNIYFQTPYGRIQNIDGKLTSNTENYNFKNSINSDQAGSEIEVKIISFKWFTIWNMLKRGLTLVECQSIGKKKV